jgi:putative acetyltransferase
MMSADVEIRIAETLTDIECVRELFLEYGRSLAFHICFETFEKEIAALPGPYGPPDGLLLLAAAAGPAGCICLRRLAPEVAEIKRLYVRPAHRGSGMGRDLIEHVIAGARQLGYAKLRLDTLPAHMQAAVSLYASLGFQRIDPYYPNPSPEAICMELVLNRAASHRT